MATLHYLVLSLSLFSYSIVFLRNILEPHAMGLQLYCESMSDTKCGSMWLTDCHLTTWEPEATGLPQVLGQPGNLQASQGCLARLCVWNNKTNKQKWLTQTEMAWIVLSQKGWEMTVIKLIGNKGSCLRRHLKIIWTDFSHYTIHLTTQIAKAVVRICVFCSKFPRNSDTHFWLELVDKHSSVYIIHFLFQILSSLLWNLPPGN